MRLPTWVLEDHTISFLNLKISEGQRFPLTGTIDQAGNDIRRIKQLGVDHIIFGSIGKDLDKVMGVTNQLSKFAR